MRRSLRLITGSVLCAGLVIGGGPVSAWSEESAPPPATDLLPAEAVKAGPAGDPPMAVIGDESSGEQSLAADEMASAEQTLERAPSSVSVTGMLVVSAVDQIPSDDGVAQPSADRAVGVAIDGGPIVAVDESTVPDDALTGQKFAGTISLSAAAQEVVAQELAEAENVGEQLDGGEALGAATLEGARLEVSGSIGAMESAPAVAPTNRPVDMVYFESQLHTLGRSDIEAFVTRVSDFWSGQSQGKLKFKKGLYREVSSDDPLWNRRCEPVETNPFNPYQLWNAAAKKFDNGWNWRKWLTGGRHLAVFVDVYCANSNNQANNIVGLGTYGQSYAAGGLTWNNIFSESPSVMGRTGLFAHELGHNLTLGHANGRYCTGSEIDSSPGGQIVRPPCSDMEYLDLYSVMGRGIDFAGATPVGLNIAQLDSLGFASGMTSFSSARGFTGRDNVGYYRDLRLSALGLSSGLRGLRIRTPDGGTFYVEYRRNVGTDGDYWLYASSSQWFGWPNTKMLPTDGGVRVLKLRKNREAGLDVFSESAVLSYPVEGTVGINGPERVETLETAGDEAIPHDSTAKIVLLNGGDPSGVDVRLYYSSFIDVPFDDPFNDEIEWMDNNNIFTGGYNKEYKPLSQLSRSAMAAFLYRVAGRPSVDTSKVRFNDVPRSHPYFREIQWMYQRGLFKGSVVNGKRLYKPDSPLSRAAMAAFLYRYQGATENVTTPQYSDVRPGDFLYKEINWMYTSGKFRPTSGRYDPNGHISRAAMAAFLSRM